MEIKILNSMNLSVDDLNASVHIKVCSLTAYFLNNTLSFNLNFNRIGKFSKIITSTSYDS